MAIDHHDSPSLEAWGWDNLPLDCRRTSKGKRDKPLAACFEYQLEDNLIQLQSELQDQSYQPRPFAGFHVHDPKHRLNSAASILDRVVHHAVCDFIEPLFEHRFIADSYANRVGKGTHRALDRCQQFARRNRYVLQCDVRQFFPSIDHAILRETLKRVIGDEVERHSNRRSLDKPHTMT